MTLIVGFVNGGEVYLGGDSSLSDGRTIRPTAEPKVFHFGPFIMGTSGSCVIPDAIFNLQPSIWEDSPLNPRATVFHFVVELKRELERLGMLGSDEGQAIMPDYSYILIGYKGRLFTVQHDFSVVEYDTDHAAIGANEELALGIIAAIRGHSEIHSPDAIVLATLDIASQVSPNIIAPFHVISTKD